MFQNFTGENPLSCRNSFLQTHGLAFSNPEKGSLWGDVAVHGLDDVAVHGLDDEAVHGVGHVPFHKTCIACVGFHAVSLKIVNL